MTSFKRGDIVIVDLGFAAKVRPCVVLSGTRPDRTRNLCVVSGLCRVVGVESKHLSP